MNVEMEREVLGRAVLDTLEDHVAGIVDQDVEPSMRAFDLREHLAPARLVAHVVLKRGAADRVGHRTRLVRRDVADEDGRALGREQLGIGAAQPHRPAGDQRHLALDPSRHRALPPPTP